MGSVIISELVVQFQRDSSEGFFIVCIRTNVFSYTGTFVGHFLSHPIQPRFFVNMFSGQYSNMPIEFPKIEKKCSEPLLFEFLDGSLPPGIEVNSFGQVQGIIPNMDCVEDNNHLSPSQNWYSEFPLDFSWYPWGRQWRFLMRVYIANRPWIVHDDWMCIRIYNNWSWDRDSFEIPLDYIEEYNVEIHPISLPNDFCCEELEIDTFTPQEIPNLELCDCDEEDNNEKSIVLKFLLWYKESIINNLEEDNPHIKEFLDKFRKTDYYRNLITQAGLEHTLYTKQELELRSFEEVIKQYQNQLINGRRDEDIDYVMLDLQTEENQKLPITILPDDGCYLDVILTTYRFIIGDDVNMPTLLISSGQSLEPFTLIEGEVYNTYSGSSLILDLEIEFDAYSLLLNCYLGNHLSFILEE